MLEEFSKVTWSGSVKKTWAPRARLFSLRLLKNNTHVPMKSVNDVHVVNEFCLLKDS